MKRRLIIVPKDKESENLLDIDEAKPEQLIELALSDEQFYYLLNKGIINLINSLGNTNIDDHEDDSITNARDILNVIKGLKSIKANSQEQALVEIEAIISLFNEALNRETGIYFYF